MQEKSNAAAQVEPSQRLRWDERLLWGIDEVLSIVCVAIVCAFTVILVLQVGLRLADRALFWAEELCQYLIVYLCFLGSAIAWGRREHIAVEFLPELLGSKWRAILTALVDLTILVFAGWACFVSAEFALFSMRKMSITLDVPVGYGYLAAPIGFGLMVIQTLIFIFGGRQAHVKPDQLQVAEEVGM